MAEESGLLKATGESLPLQSVSIAADIKGYVLGLCAKLTYENKDDDPVEVLFKMPLESTQAVVGLTALIDGKRIRAGIQEKEEAKSNYDDAIASGRTSAFAEQKTEDVFSIALGNLPGKGQAEIELQMVNELPVDGEGKIRFSLPTGLKPRYTPEGSTDPLAPPIEGGTMHAGKISGVQDFLLRVHKAESIAEVTSPTHAISSVNANESDILNVTLKDGTRLTSDLVIQVAQKTPHEPLTVVEYGQELKKGQKKGFLNHPAVMVNFYPEIPETDISCELIFLVDRSGSMSGGFIKSASETLILFLKSMPEGSYFNIYGFGSRFESLFPVSVVYNQETLAKATTHAQNLKADLGGTEILPPLRKIFEQPGIKGITRQVFLLTDGAVNNTAACIEEVKKNSHKARCFTFGIGSGASTALVNGMAQAGNGTAEFVKFGERLQPKVIRSLKHSLQPAVSDVKVSFSVPSNVKVLVSPKNLPPLFNGDKTVIYGILETDGNGTVEEGFTGEVNLNGTLLGAEISHSLFFKVTPSSSRPIPEESLLPIHHLAAKRLIEDMKQDGEPSVDIVKMSIEAQVISNETAFIAVYEDTSKAVTGPMKTFDLVPSDDLFCDLSAITAVMATNIDRVCERGDALENLQEQPDLLSAESTAFYKSSKSLKSGSSGFKWISDLGSSVTGWFKGSSGSNEQLEDVMENSKMNYASEISECLGSDILIDLDEEEEGGGDNSLFSPKRVERQSKPLNPSLPKPSAAGSSAAAIILIQQANGSWLLDESFASSIGVSLHTLESSCPAGCSSKTVWATVLAVVTLKVRYPSQQDEWELVAMKASSWLKGQTSESLLKGFMDAAKGVV